MFRLALLLSSLALSGAIFSYPWHASCKVEWQLGQDCDRVKDLLVTQMNAWAGEESCGETSDSCPALPCGQNCLYQHGNTFEGTSKIDDGWTIVATHTTPVARYIDDMTFELTPGGAGQCGVVGRSRSRLWYAVLDYGTNYCNLRNLLDGAGLNNSNGFTEQTENSVCTQFTSRDCSRY